MNLLNPKRPLIQGLLFGLLLGGGVFFSAPQLAADPSGFGAFVSQPEREDSAAYGMREPEHTGAERVGKAKESNSAQLQEEGYADAARPAEEAELGPWDGRMGDEADLEWVRDPEFNSEPAPQGDGGSRDSAVEKDEVRVEWVYEGEDTAGAYAEDGDKAVDAVVEQPRGTAFEEEEEEGSRGAGGMEEGLLFRQRVSAKKTSLGLSFDRYHYPDELLEPHWTQCLEVLGNGSISSLQSELNRLYEAKLDAGFRNMPDYGTLLVRRAYRLLEAGDSLEARLLGEAAYNLAPEYYPVSLCLSRLAGKDPQLGLGKYFSWKWVSLKQRFQDFLWQFAMVGKAFALLLMALYLFFLFLGLYFLGRYARVLLHFVHERFPVGSIGMAAVGAVLLGTLAVLLCLPGPFWVTVFLGFLSGRFARRWEKVCYSVFLLLWAVSPWLFNQTVCFFSPLSDGTHAIHRCIQGNWNSAGEEALKAAVQTNPESLDLQLTQALVEKRRGEYEEALRVLKQALLEYPLAGRLWNNLGNLHAIQGDLEEAKEAYRKAVLYGNGTAAPHYNLSQLLRRQFSFLKGAQEYQAARKIDAERVDYFTYIHSPNPNRFFMDEEPRKTALWRHAFYRDPETERAADDVWSATAAGIPLRQTPWVFLFLAGVYILFAARRRSGQEPFACSSCGRVVCGKCDTGAEVGGLCSPCYQALYQRENIPKERRHEQIRKMARHQSRRSRRLLLLNLLLPGVGFSLLEEKPRGMFILFGFFFLLLVAGFWSNMLPVPMTVWETGGSVLRILSIVLLSVLYVVIQRRFITKIRARR